MTSHHNRIPKNENILLKSRLVATRKPNDSCRCEFRSTIIRPIPYQLIAAIHSTQNLPAGSIALAFAVRLARDASGGCLLLLVPWGACESTVCAARFDYLLVDKASDLAIEILALDQKAIGNRSMVEDSIRNQDRRRFSGRFALSVIDPMVC